MDTNTTRPGTSETRYVIAEDLVGNSEDISLVGDNGGKSKVTGLIEYSSTIPGTVMFETEHGVLYVAGEVEVTITTN